MSIEITDLNDNRLGESLPGSIRLDVNAAGVGWFLDPTPAVDEEFASGSLLANHPDALGRVDLLTVVLHELFHQLGAEDSDQSIHPANLMAETLPPSQRRLPKQDVTDDFFMNTEMLSDLLEA